MTLKPLDRHTLHGVNFYYYFLVLESKTCLKVML